MSSVVGLLRSWSLPRVFALTATAVGVAGCSADSTRFNDSPFARSGSSEVTGSTPAPVAPNVPAGRVEQSYLPPPSGAQPTPAAPVSGGGRGMASYAPATYSPPPPETTGSVQAPPYKPAVAAPAARPASPAPAGRATNVAGGVHVVAPGDTLSKISRRYGKSITDLAKANNIEPHATLRIGERIVIPGTQPVSARAKEPPKLAQQPKSAAATPVAKPAPAPKQVASTEPAQGANVLTPSAEQPTQTASLKANDGPPSFRWPVKGRVIAGFGPKTNGQQNDGINLAVPEGTPIKAAEDGVVAYAGNELKGYGNLVLVRHSNGYVTAYAHAKELLVKRGDTIRRGQVIAKSGQTGNVDTPQLHFEVRKGPSPLDPLPMLSGG